MTESFGGGGGGGTGPAGPGAGGVAGIVAAGWVPLVGLGRFFLGLQTGRFLRRCFFLRAAASASTDERFALWCLRLAGVQRDFFFLRLRRLAAVANSTMSFSAGGGSGMRQDPGSWTVLPEPTS